MAYGLAALLVFSTTVRAATDASMPTSARCDVWARELSFARSVAEHDAAGFRAHLHAGAVFGAGRDRPARGPDAIAQRWAGIVEGKAITIEWYPTHTTDSADAPGVAWSSGPSLVIENPGAADARYSIGAFHSVWRRGEDGVWRVLFDDGADSRPADAEQVRAFRAGRRDACPEPPAGPAAAQASIEREPARTCLALTGSRITAQRNLRAAREGRPERECANSNGRVYSEQDIERTGQRGVADALRSLDTGVR